MGDSGHFPNQPIAMPEKINITDLETPAGPTHATRAYAHLRGKLIAGEFKPGTRLLYGPIGKEIGVSATPVREAAGQLAQEGLVKLVPNLGAVVNTPNREDLIEVYEVRKIIEPPTAALAAQRASTAEIDSIESQLIRMKEITTEHIGQNREYANEELSRLFDRADCQFHLLINEASHNAALVRTASQSHVLTRVFGIRRHHYTAAGMRRTCQEHQNIVAAIRCRDSDAAAAACAEHISNGLSESLATVDETT